MSGYGRGYYQTSGRTDGALDREDWTNNVFLLAGMIDYHLEEDFRDGVKKSGSYLACHAEKQLLARLMWDHTVDWRRNNAIFLLNCQPPSLRRLRANIVIWRGDFPVMMC